MADEPKRQIADYYTPPPKRRKLPEGPEARRWRYRRVWYRVGLLVFFGAIAFGPVPNLMSFGQLTRPGPADFVAMVQKQCVPTVRAIKEYQRDNGFPPASLDALVPRYLPVRPTGWQDFSNGWYWCRAKYGHTIDYNFTPGAEGWLVTGPYAYGPIPLPPVTIGPATQPAGAPK